MAAPERASFFGINPGRELLSTETATDPRADAEAAEFQQIGVKNPRILMAWNYFQQSDCSEHQTGPINFTNYDKLVERAALHGMRLVATLGENDVPAGCGVAAAAWYPRPGTQLFTDFTRGGGFVWEMVQRYGFKGSFWTSHPNVPYLPIRVWEVWNEPNEPAFSWGGQVNPQAYAQLLVATAAAIRGSQATLQSLETTNTQVLLGGLAPFSEGMTPTEFMNSIYHSPSGYNPTAFHNSFDGLSLHPYALSQNALSAEDRIEEGRTVLNQARGALGGESDSTKPLWLTEIGWPVMPQSSTPTETLQAQYLSETLSWAYSHAQSQNIRYAAVYFDQDLTTSCESWSCWPLVTGLKRSDGVPRKSWCVFVQQLGVSPCGETKWEREGLGGTFVSDLDISSWEPGRLDVFGRGLENALWHRYWVVGIGWSAWERIGGELASGPSAASWGSGRIDVVARATNNTVLHWYWDAASGGGWHQDNLQGTIASDPDISSWGAGRLDVVARSPQGTLVHRAWSNAWFPWEDLGGNIAGGPTTVSWEPGRIDVAARTPSNTIAHWFWSSGWHSDTIPGTITSDPDLASRGPGKLDLFAGLNDGLQHSWWENGVGWSSIWEGLGGPIIGGPGAVSWGPNRVDAVARTTNGAALHWNWTK